MNCDMCHRPLKPDSKRYVITTLFRPDLELTVGPDCYRAEKKARKERVAQMSAAEVENMRAKVRAIAVADAMLADRANDGAS